MVVAAVVQMKLNVVDTLDETQRGTGGLVLQDYEGTHIDILFSSV